MLKLVVYCSMTDCNNTLVIANSNNTVDYINATYAAGWEVLKREGLPVDSAGHGNRIHICPTCKEFIS